MKAKCLATGMVLPLAMSVLLSTAPAASAATPTKAAFSESANLTSVVRCVRVRVNHRIVRRCHAVVH
jgi:hypothetical protein